MTGKKALAALDAEIVERERLRWVAACRVRDRAIVVAREALERWTQAEKARRK